jgi:hypothetical protein
VNGKGPPLNPLLCRWPSKNANSFVDENPTVLNPHGYYASIGFCYQL